MKTLRHFASSALLSLVWCFHAHTATAQVATFDLHLQPSKFTLYTDPYNANQLKIGGFSGLYPVPGEPDSFFVITDRGPAPDFVDANTNAYKTFALPGFGTQLWVV